jgi:penicillin-binding protein 2
VSSLQGAEGQSLEKPVEAGVQASVESWRTVHDAMRRVVEAGTAGAVRLPYVTVGGKTGTAQNPHGQDHALFVCFAPVDSPRVAMAIVAENSGHGGSVSAPIAAAVLKRMFAPDTTRVVAPPPPSPADTVGD